MEWAYCVIVPALAAVVFLAFCGGVGEPSGGSSPDYSGRSARRTSDIENDESIHETAAKLNQKGGRELGCIPTVHYRPGCDHWTWADACWIARHFPDKITGDIPASDHDRQVQNERYYNGELR